MERSTSKQYDDFNHFIKTESSMMKADLSNNSISHQIRNDTNTSTSTKILLLRSFLILKKSCILFFFRDPGQSTHRKMLRLVVGRLFSSAKRSGKRVDVVGKAETEEGGSRIAFTVVPLLFSHLFFFFFFFFRFFDCLQSEKH